jgi:hypothetical protein
MRLTCWVSNWTINIIKRSDAAKGFEVLPRRWVVNDRTMLPMFLVSSGPRSFVGQADGGAFAG